VVTSASEELIAHIFSKEQVDYSLKTNLTVIIRPVRGTDLEARVYVFLSFSSFFFSYLRIRHYDISD
jgi:hypothetical protein